MLVGSIGFWVGLLVSLVGRLVGLVDWFGWSIGWFAVGQSVGFAVRAPAPVSTPRGPVFMRFPTPFSTRARIDPASTAPFARPHPFSRVFPRCLRAHTRPKPRIFGCIHPVYIENDLKSYCLRSCSENIHVCGPENRQFVGWLVGGSVCW